MARPFTNNDEGMTVRTADGDEVGTIETVEGSKAHVKPESSLSESIRTRLGLGDATDEMYTLDNSDVESITEEGVELKN